MKKIIMSIVFLVSISQLLSQEDFHYDAKGNKIEFKVRKDKLIIKTSSNKQAEQLLKQKEFKQADALNHYLFVEIDTVKTKKKTLTKNKDISDFTYMLEYADGTLQAPTDQIFVKCKKGENIEDIFSKTGIKTDSIELMNEIDSIYLITLNSKIENTMGIVRILYKTGLCEFAEPSFMRFIKPYNPYYSYQWGMKNTGQQGGIRGMDINVEAAWSITRGNGIKVAIIDEGVNFTHPDLAANMISGYDAVLNKVGGGGANFNNHHGTACAGIVGALDDNTGIVGVAPQCKIIPIRIAYKRDLDGKWETNDTWIANGIKYAWQTAGADVLSNSWGGGSFSETIQAAINGAFMWGRNGKGAVVVFASGNDNAGVNYPANSDDRILVVGAMSMCGQRKSPSSCDLENWGSNYGYSLDVVAPGVKIYTTIHQGHTSNFNGTSSACPFVAGVAALVLAANPALSYQQVCNIIESTCKKVGGYSYSQRGDGWNNEMGFGLVDAYAAVMKVIPPCTLRNYYSNRSISSNTTFGSDCNMQIQNVNVYNGIKLTVNAKNEIDINGPFDVASGSELETFRKY